MLTAYIHAAMSRTHYEILEANEGYYNVAMFRWIYCPEYYGRPALAAKIGNNYRRCF
jgi:hypothetical protein